MVISPDSTSKDAGILVWNLQTGEKLLSLPGVQKGQESYHWSATLSWPWQSAWGRDGTARIWKILEGSLWSSVQPGLHMIAEREAMADGWCG